MITEKDLYEAIAECQGQRNPNANTCIKLAAYYTILQNITDNKQTNPDPTYSFAGPPVNSVMDYDGNSEFFQLANGMDQNDVMSIVDELMITLQIVDPRLYDSVIRKIAEV